jgi:hypothetical protein
MKVGDLVRIVSRKFLDCGEVVKDIDVGILIDEREARETSSRVAYILGRQETVIGYHIGFINEKTKWELHSV